MTRPGNDDRFDDAMRDLHAQSLSQLSAATTAQLHRRRHSALQDAARPRRLFGWPAAAAFASLLVVALGIGFALQSVGDTPQSPTPVADTNPGDDFDATYAALDENPDFFLWLASNDATLLAME